MKIILSEHTYNQLVGKKSQTKQNIHEKFNFTSFEVQDTLNPDIFDAKNHMIKEVRKKLLQIGKDFYNFLGIGYVDLKDIILTGSMANYNWSAYSDVDLHVVLEYNQISKNSDLVDEFTWTKKELWNEEHNIKIKDYDVEMYVQDTKDNLIAGGVYSVLYDKWLKMPKKEQLNFNKEQVGKLVNNIEAKIDELIKRYLMGDCYGLTGDIDNIKAAISKMRKQGLANGGEFSPENLAFKALRRMDLLDKLDDMKNQLYDDSLSVEKSRGEKLASGDIQRTKKQSKSDENDDEESGDGKGRWMVNGRRFKSLRIAEKVLGIPRATIQWRMNSDNPEYNSYKQLEE